MKQKKPDKGQSSQNTVKKNKQTRKLVLFHFKSTFFTLFSGYELKRPWKPILEENKLKWIEIAAQGIDNLNIIDNKSVDTILV